MEMSVRRASAWMSSATLLQRGISVATQLVVATLLSPSDYGRYAAVSIVIVLAQSVQATTRPQLILIWQDGDNPASVRRSYMSGLAAAAVVGILLASAASLRVEVDLQLLIAAFATAPIVLLPSCRTANLAATSRFPLLAASSTAGVVSRGLATVSCAYLTSSPISFIVGIWFGAIAEFLFSRRSPTSLMSPRSVGEAPSLALVGSGILMGIGASADFAIAGALLPAAAAGAYFFAFQVTTAVAAPFTASLTTVLVPALRRAKSATGGASQKLSETLSAVGIAATFGGGFVLLAGPWLIEVAYGNKWIAAAAPLRVLALSLPFRLMLVPILASLQAEKRYRSYMQLLGGRATLTVLMSYLGALSGSIVGVALCISIAQVLSLLAGIRLLRLSGDGAPIYSQNSAAAVLLLVGIAASSLVFAELTTPPAGIAAFLLLAVSWVVVLRRRLRLPADAEPNVLDSSVCTNGATEQERDPKW